MTTCNRRGLREALDNVIYCVIIGGWAGGLRMNES
jgi:hypothetical protein